MKKGNHHQCGKKMEAHWVADLLGNEVYSDLVITGACTIDTIWRVAHQMSNTKRAVVEVHCLHIQKMYVLELLLGNIRSPLSPLHQ